MLEPGTRLGPYEILVPLGAGGMGEVHRARDTRLGRDVAVKVLPQHLSADPEVRARFEREAKTVSSLNHPNICTLFDVGREGETDYLVMELVEGETLAERLRRGPLPGPELLRLGAQVADALDRAHRAGVIHRDLKPGNIMLTRSGAKLMDFGLARATGMRGPAGASGTTMAALTQSPTVAQPLTAEGTIVGTFQYLSPEQLEGREADARSDLWALGCVLYEMATGRRAFEGRSQASLIAAILERQPAAIAEAPPSGSGVASAPGAPQGLDRLVRALLVKDPEERIQTAHDVKLQLQWIAESAGLSGAGVPATGVPAVAPPGPRAGRAAALAWGVAGVAIVAAVAVGAWAWARLHAPPPLYRFHPDVDVPGGIDPNWPRVSPDGRSLVFEAADSAGTQSAWLLRLDEMKARPIPGSEGLARAYWSPDGREIAFVAGGKIERLPISGGSPVIVCPAPGGSDLSWGSRGLILLDGTSTDSLRVVPAGGGELRPATRISRADHEMGTAWPCFLPDGEHFLFIGTRGDGQPDNIRLGRIGSLDSRLLGHSGGRVEYAPGGWVLFTGDNSLLAQKLDLGAGRLSGQPITLVDDLRMGSSAGHFSASPSGVFALQHSVGETGRELRFVDRSGAPLGPAIATGSVANPHVSPDGKRVLYERRGDSSAPWGDVSVHDIERGTDTRLTFTGGWAVLSQWSPDGRRFAYTRTSASGVHTLVIGAADGLGALDSIVVPAGGAFLSQWAAAGSRLVFYSGATRVYAVPSDGPERRPAPLVDSTLHMGHPVVSPDGRWVAGVVIGLDTQIFVQNLTGPPGRWQITSSPGGKPVWTKGGRELVWEGSDGRIMAADIDTRAGFHAGTPHALFSLPLRSSGREISSWTCDATGERFVVVSPPRTARRERSIEVVTDFRPLVSRR